MKNYVMLSLVVLVGLSGCSYRKKKDKKEEPNRNRMVTMANEVAIPVAGNEIRDFLLDENLDELTLIDDNVEYAAGDLYGKAETQVAVNLNDEDEFSWIQESADERQFKNVYFAFDSYEVNKDQIAAVEYDIALAKRVIEEHMLFGDASHKPTIVVDGNSCHSAGSKAYNLVLSEQRAKVLEEKFVAAGIPRDYIKIVGRGSEIPVVMEGKIVTGDREQQWPNRRDELRIIFS